MNNSRLLRENAAGGQIMFSEATYGAIEAGEATRLDSVKLTGRLEPISVYVVEPSFVLKK